MLLLQNLQHASLYHTSRPLLSEKETDATSSSSSSSTTTNTTTTTDNSAATTKDTSTTKDTTTPPPPPPPRQYSTPELTRDAAIHKAALLSAAAADNNNNNNDNDNDNEYDDSRRPDWQNPLIHDQTQREGPPPVYRDDFESDAAFAAAVQPTPPLTDPATPAYLEALAEEIVQLTVLEMNELVNKMVDHYGHSEDMFSPDDDDTAGIDGEDDEDDEAAPAAEAKTVFDIRLTGFDAKAKIKVIKEVRSMAGLGLKEAKELVEGAPTTILKDYKAEAAEEVKKKLEELGATVEIV